MIEHLWKKLRHALTNERSPWAEEQKKKVYWKVPAIYSSQLLHPPPHTVVLFMRSWTRSKITKGEECGLSPMRREALTRRPPGKSESNGERSKVRPLVCYPADRDDTTRRLADALVLYLSLSFSPSAASPTKRNDEQGKGEDELFQNLLSQLKVNASITFEDAGSLQQEEEEVEQQSEPLLEETTATAATLESSTESALKEKEDPDWVLMDASKSTYVGLELEQQETVIFSTDCQMVRSSSLFISLSAFEVRATHDSR
jgi:hypothetical protein